jgi:serine/threonine-protein kinase
LYALGALLYALLTGRPPFGGDSPDEIIAKVRAGKVAKPSKTVRAMPPPFEAAVLRLLAPRPEDRFQNAAEMLAVVEQIANFHEIKV